jgi:hypothetical protein
MLTKRNATIILVVAVIIILIILLLFSGSQDAQYRGGMVTSTVPGVITLTPSGPTGTPGIIESPQVSATP